MMLMRRITGRTRPIYRPSRSLRSAHVALRPLSTLPPPPPINDSGIRISTVFGVLLCLGIGATAYGVYEFYSTFTMWPPELRGDLRAGLKAKHQGNLVLSEKYLRRAWDTSRALALEILAPQPYLKLSGIGIALAGVLEEDNRPQQAYEVYVDVLKDLQTRKELGQGKEKQQQPPLSEHERMRIVAVAHKLGEMAETYQQPPEEEEKWLTVAVEEVLRIVKDMQVAAKKGEEREKGKEKAVKTLFDELELPGWVSRTDLAAPFEALAAFYTRAGNIDYAFFLYVHAASILIPPPPQESSPEDRCRGALLMNNLSELIVRQSPTPEKVHQAEAWANQALEVVKKTKETCRGDERQLSGCESALAVILINLGALREMANDHPSATEFFKAGLEQAKSIKMKEGIQEAHIALRRLSQSDQKSIPDTPNSLTK